LEGAAVRRFIVKDGNNWRAILDLYADNEFKDIENRLVERREIRYGAYCNDYERSDDLFVDYAERSETSYSGIYGEENALAFAVKKRDDMLKQALSKERIVELSGDDNKLKAIEEVTDKKRLNMDIRDLLLLEDNPDHR
jgi:hypothetical protein